MQAKQASPRIYRAWNSSYVIFLKFVLVQAPKDLFSKTICKSEGLRKETKHIKFCTEYSSLRHSSKYE